MSQNWKTHREVINMSPIYLEAFMYSYIISLYITSWTLYNLMKILLCSYRWGTRGSETEKDFLKATYLVKAARPNGDGQGLNLSLLLLRWAEFFLSVVRIQFFKQQIRIGRGSRRGEEVFAEMRSGASRKTSNPTGRIQCTSPGIHALNVKFYVPCVNTSMCV